MLVSAPAELDLGLCYALKRQLAVFATGNLLIFASHPMSSGRLDRDDNRSNQEWHCFRPLSQRKGFAVFISRNLRLSAIDSLEPAQ
jgi:hypothetical protein